MKRLILTFLLVALPACSPTAPAATKADTAALSPKVTRLSALRIAGLDYAPVTASAALHTGPTEEGFACDSVSFEETTLRACGKGPAAAESLVALGEHTDPGQRYRAMAEATKAILSVVDPGATPDQLAMVQKEVEAATRTQGDNVRVCTPGACLKVSASPGLWSLAATVPNS